MKTIKLTENLGVPRFALTAVLAAFILTALLTAARTALGAPAVGHFTGCAFNTGVDMTIGFPVGSVQTGSFTPATGDEIAAFKADGSLCTGRMVFDSSAAGATIVYGSTVVPPAAGMDSAETIQWRIWDASTDQEHFANTTYLAGENTFKPGGIQQVISFIPGGPTAVTLAALEPLPPPQPFLPFLLVAGLGLFSLFLFRLRAR